MIQVKCPSLAINVSLSFSWRCGQILIIYSKKILGIGQSSIFSSSNGWLMILDINNTKLQKQAFSLSLSLVILSRYQRVLNFFNQTSFWEKNRTKNKLLKFILKSPGDSNRFGKVTNCIDIDSYNFLSTLQNVTLCMFLVTYVGIMFIIKLFE